MVQDLVLDPKATGGVVVDVDLFERPDGDLEVNLPGDPVGLVEKCVVPLSGLGILFIGIGVEFDDRSVLKIEDPVRLVVIIDGLFEQWRGIVYFIGVTDGSFLQVGNVLSDDGDHDIWFLHGLEEQILHYRVRFPGGCSSLVNYDPGLALLGDPE